MTMKFKFEHILNKDNNKMYKLVSFKCLPASELPRTYLHGNKAKVYTVDGKKSIDFGYAIIHRISINERIPESLFMDFVDTVTDAGCELVRAREYEEHLKRWNGSYTTIKL